MALSVEFKKNESGTLSWCHPSRSLLWNFSGNEMLYLL